VAVRLARSSGKASASTNLLISETERILGQVSAGIGFDIEYKGQVLRYSRVIIPSHENMLLLVRWRQLLI